MSSGSARGGNCRFGTQYDKGDVNPLGTWAGRRAQPRDS
jgi:hypothetical protein